MTASAMRVSADRHLRIAVAQQVGAMVLLQSGSGATVGALLGRIGVGPTTFLRLAFSSVVLCALRRPDWRAFSSATRIDVATLGVVLAVQGFLAMTAFEHLPLGIVVSITFLGPLGLAVTRLPSVRWLVWPLMAAAGVGLLVNPLGGAAPSVVGVLAAFGSAVCWALYLILSARLGARLPAVDGLTAAMTVAALLCLPIGVLEVDKFASVEVLAIALGIAVVSVALPLSLETLALKHLTLTAAGVLTSLEPAVAGLVGYLLLGQRLDAAEISGIGLVVVASIGAVRTVRDPKTA